MAQENGFGKGVMIGLIAGAATGAIVALLYAPKSGKELRKDIKDKADDLKNDINYRYDAAKTKLNEMIQEGKMQAEIYTGNAKDKVNNWITEAESVLEDVKVKTKNETERIQEAVKSGWEAGKSEYTKS